MAGFVFGKGRSGGRWAYGPSPTGGMGWRLEGVEKVTSNINKVLNGMTVRGHAGLVSAANYILTDADIGQPPLVPALTGNLRSSRFTEPFDAPGGTPAVVFGYSANYAAAVHEMMSSVSGAPINWSRPGSGPKFFEASIRRNQKKIPVIIAKHI